MAVPAVFTTIIQSFVGAPAFGSGLINQWVYTVPAGKRAIVRDVFVEVQDNANAVNTTIADIFCTIGATSHTIVKQYNDGAGNNTLIPNTSRSCEITLPAGATVTGRSQNTGAAAVAMIIRAVIEEYG